MPELMTEDRIQELEELLNNHDLLVQHVIDIYVSRNRNIGREQLSSKISHYYREYEKELLTLKNMARFD